MTEYFSAIEEGIAVYSSKSINDVEELFPLNALERCFEKHPEKTKLMFALVDLKLTFYFATNDFMQSGVVWNENLNSASFHEESPSKQTASKILFLSNLNSFVLRSRSYWDKALGVLVLVYATNDYERFVSSKSRRARFKKIMATHLQANAINFIHDTIEILDDKFRTAEAQQTSTLRTWVLKEGKIDLFAGSFGWLLGVYNDTYGFSNQLSSLLLEWSKDK